MDTLRKVYPSNGINSYMFLWSKMHIHIIDLNKTVAMLEEAAAAMKQIAKSGKKILFVATKKQATINCSRSCKKVRYALHY